MRLSISKLHPHSPLLIASFPRDGPGSGSQNGRVPDAGLRHAQYWEHRRGTRWVLAKYMKLFIGFRIYWCQVKCSISASAMANLVHYLIDCMIYSWSTNLVPGQRVKSDHGNRLMVIGHHRIRVVTSVEAKRRNVGDIAGVLLENANIISELEQTKRHDCTL